MTAQPHTSGLGSQDVELADVRSSTTANMQDHDHGNTNPDHDRAGGVYRPRSADSSDSPPAYVLKPPPYTAEDPALTKPQQRRWNQWAKALWKRLLLLAIVILVPAIVFATIYGIMKARAQAIVNALQFERGDRTVLDLVIYGSEPTIAEFSWQDTLWNNDSHYKELNFDHFETMTFTLEGATLPFETIYDDYGIYFYQPNITKQIYGYLSNDALSLEVLRSMMHQEEVSVWLEGSTKVKISKYLPRYAIQFKKKIKFPGFGGIFQYDPFRPEIWNLSDPEQLQPATAKYPRFFNFQDVVGRGLGAGPSGPDVDERRSNDDTIYGLSLNVDIYENGTETRLGQGNLTDFLNANRRQKLTAMVDVDYIAETAKLYEDGMMPWVLRPTGAFRPSYDSPDYYVVEDGYDAPWLFEVVKEMEFRMVVNVTQG